MVALTRDLPLGLAKYVAFVELSLRRTVAERIVVLARMAFYVIILLVFSRLWMVVLERGAVAGLGPVECLWYLAVTEWVALSQPPVHLDIEREVRTGEVAARITRPVSYAGSKAAEALGELMARLLLLGGAGFFAAFALSGALPGDPRGMAFLLPLGLLAGVLLTLMHTLIGLTAFWLEDVSPGYWIFQKLTFVLGGLMLPLDIYPTWLQQIALWSPFSAALYGPGQMVLRFDAVAAAATGTKLLCWIALVVLAIAVMQQRALRALEAHGG